MCWLREAALIIAATLAPMKLSAFEAHAGAFAVREQSRNRAKHGVRGGRHF
jgi:hypothetical protein